MLKILIAVVVTALAPVGLLLFMVIGGMALVFNIFHHCCCRYTNNCWLMMPNILISIPIGAVVGLAGYAIVIGPLVLFGLFFILNAIYRWCLSSRRVKTTQ